MRQLSDKDYNESGAARLVFISKTSQAKELAELDIKKNRPFILMQTGIVPTIYGSDMSFEIDYGVYHLDFGCTGPDERIIKAYNRRVFKYLDEKYGKKWRREIRKEIIGLKEYKRSSR